MVSWPPNYVVVCGQVPVSYIKGRAGCLRHRVQESNRRRASALGAGDKNPADSGSELLR